eukprot:227781-Amphidinium_carterae.1
MVGLQAKPFSLVHLLRKQEGRLLTSNDDCGQPACSGAIADIECCETSNVDVEDVFARQLEP